MPPLCPKMSMQLTQFPNIYSSLGVFTACPQVGALMFELVDRSNSCAFEKYFSVFI